MIGENFPKIVENLEGIRCKIIYESLTLCAQLQYFK
jgi:hypothetical protein